MEGFESNHLPDEIRKSLHDEIEHDHQMVIGPDQNETREANDRAHLETQLEKQGFQERITDVCLNFIRKPSKKVKIFLGLFTFLAGLGIAKKDQILDWGAQAVMQNPYVMAKVDRDSNTPFMASQNEQTEDIETEQSQISNKIPSVEIEGNKLNLIKDFSELKTAGTEFDKGDKIAIEDEILKNIIQLNNINVEKPVEQAKFDQFVRDQIKNYFSKNVETVKSDFEEGSVEKLLDVAEYILNKNMKYDQKTESWLKESRDGRLSLRWSKANPVASFFSTDGYPVDKLLMEEKRGICRQYSDAFCLVVEEIKQLYPDKFQNVYPTAFHDSYQWHVYNLIFVAKNGHEMNVFASEPQTKYSNAMTPAYELLKTLRDRGILTPNKYLDTMKQYLQMESGHESDIDILAIINSAEQENRPDVIQVAKNYFVKKGDMESIDHLKTKGLASDDDFVKTAARYITHHQIDEYIVEKIVKQSTTMKPEHQKQIKDALRSMLMNPNYEHMGTFNYENMLKEYKQRGVISSHEYLTAYEKFYDKFDERPDPEFLDFLLTQKEYYPAVRKHLLKSLENSVDFPRWIREDFIDGEYRSWDRETAITEPANNREHLLKEYKKQIERYRQLTGEDLVELTQQGFDAEMTKLRAYLATNPKHEK